MKPKVPVDRVQTLVSSERYFTELERCGAGSEMLKFLVPLLPVGKPVQIDGGCCVEGVDIEL